MRNLPFGILAIAGLFAVGVIASGSSFLALTFPHTWLNNVWRLNPIAHEQLLALGFFAPLLMLLVCIACASAAFGLLRRASWGRGLAIAILAVNIAADTGNALLRDDLRTLIGLPIGALLIVYLLRAKVANLYARPRGA